MVMARGVPTILPMTVRRTCRRLFLRPMDQLRAVDALSSDWIAGILLVAVGMLAWVNMASHRQWVVLARSFGALRLGRHRMREELDVRDRALTGLAVMSTMVIALFAYQVLLFHGLVQAGAVSFLQVFLVVALVLLARLGLLEGVGLLSARDGGLQEYQYTVVVFHVVLGLMLLPVAMLMAYPGQVAWRGQLWLAGVLLVVAVLLFRWVRAVAIGLGNGTPLRYIFLYLCTLEILPSALAMEHVRDFAKLMPTP